MRPLTLEEFAQQLRIKGDYRETEFADEILLLIDIEEEVAEPYSDLTAEVEHQVKDAPPMDTPLKAVEWLANRSNMLAGIEKHFEKVDMKGDVDDLTRQVLDELGNIETIMEEHGGWTEGDLQEALFALIERAAPKLEYDL